MTSALVVLTTNVGLVGADGAQMMTACRLKNAADEEKAENQYNYATYLLNGGKQKTGGAQAAHYFKLAADQGHAGGK